MGKLSCDPLIHHFSHPHPLELCNIGSFSNISAAPCAGCKEALSGWVYLCKLCNNGFCLHVSCSQMPQLIHHPSHAIHPLSLLPTPAYSAGYFNCDACGRRGDGFSYHCGACDLDVHVLCAAMPLSLPHRAHAHPLNLEFIPPYHNKGFSCDLCGNLGSNHWLYRCGPCEFDAHLRCATAKQGSLGATVGVQALQAPAQFRGPVATPPVQMGLPQQYYQVQQVPGAGNSCYVNPGPAGLAGPAGAPRDAGGAGGGNNLMQVMMQGLVDGASQQIGQSLVQSLIGGGEDNGGGDGNVSSFTVMDIGSAVFVGCDDSGSSPSDY
ncbi:hypothetical protein H6P81_018385 [Aristolochia fimbriata]|uniref:DC1 domain-containing protein n=1 Tax=Aristolochia fimbriata TaxID=158543 RepID=A0AAV7E441_ARIFI|nr:hypothetical protein H6P81_018385 [Aristolochia fimbriata]